MTVLTPSAALAIAMQCVTPYSMATVAVGIAQHESGLETQTVHRNTNGTVDYGLAGINTINLGWLGLTPETALDPCKNPRRVDQGTVQEIQWRTTARGCQSLRR